MALSWNEIKDRALRFSKDWEGEKRERAEKDSFYNDFFNVFGISRRRVATFEEPIKKLTGNQGFIDLFWKGTLMVEHKSFGKNLDSAFEQATDYFAGLKEHELPKYILVSDFARFKLYDLDEKTEHEFALADFHKEVKLFGFIAGYQKKQYQAEDPVNVKAAELMGKLHDELEQNGYEGHALEVFLVRLLFCLFADDTSIFEKDTFKDYLEQRTREDGSDLGMALAQFFQVLNTPMDKRQKSLDEQLAAFPYVNGSLFEEMLPIAAFNSTMRELLLQCCGLDWGKISPAIFGSMFQSVMNPEERRNLGAHYTSETNILKLIKPLFLDELWEEFERVKKNSKQLAAFHHKLGTLKFLDPACGCGNFLVITYRELRLLELEVLRVQHKNQQVIGIGDIIWIDVDQFYGIEYDEWPAKIAEVALWLMDHQMNMRIGEEFGEYFVRLPLKKSATIVHGNALRVDWESVVPKTELSFILGNPPFIGSKMMSTGQRTDLLLAFNNSKGSGTLDYVSAWYIKAANYISGTNITSAFVSTNSITQGEQVSALWGEMFKNYGIKIHFAHRTFNWSNEARGNAAVHVVIIGFGAFDIPSKLIYDYEDIKGEPHEIKGKNINPYLVIGDDLVIAGRSKALSQVPKIAFGNQPNDGGGFLFTDEEYKDFVTKEPEAAKFIRPFVGSYEYINNVRRWCLWLREADPSELKKLPHVMGRIEIVKNHRLSSTRPATVDLASTPTLFGFTSHTGTPYIIIPSVSSERRKYIPIGFMPPEVITSNLCLVVPDAGIFHFGILTSDMHMSWVKYVGGRLKSDYRYSNSVVYNNYPWPKEPTAAQKKEVEERAQAVLDARLKYPNSSLADLYDPLTMPPDLVKAHQALDKAVDKCYRSKPFANETERIEFLFELYGEYTAPLLKIEKKKGK
ncbi:MAG: class I SAM-dependent DNA methyltransferase [Flavobacteriales bacterium]|nr:class I SAM-dependent DNA methyltransferase [Flavobacteriales bacterium]